MGGAFARGGNVTPAAEANIWVDPQAADEVFTTFSGADEARPRSVWASTSRNGP